MDLSRQLEDRCKWLEEKFKAMEIADYHYRVDAKDLSLVSDLVLPPKFKTPNFEKYSGTSYPEAHITMTVWPDLRPNDIAPDRITLQNMEKKPSKSFRQYAQRWREIATQVQPPLLEKETTMLFINTLKAPFINHMLKSATKSFSDIVMSKEMIENAIRCGEGRKVRYEVAEVKTPLRQVWKEMVKRELIVFESKERFEGKRNHCKFHDEEGHEIQECTEFKAIVQNLMDNKEMEFYEEIKGSEGREVYASDEGSVERVQKGSRPVVIISKPRVDEARIQVTPGVIIKKPIAFPYRDSKRVPWNYDCNVIIPGNENLVDASKEVQEMGFYTRSGKRYDTPAAKTDSVKGKSVMENTTEAESLINKPVTEKEAKEFLKFLKHSEYSVVEQLHKQLARI
ncbi:Gag-pro-like protein [Gossypium australe]|uniref:Gag-pro-like protein n=1 Tax=Gossypium australe TaxID=47621 RepID=A0A5B6V8T3_9ROSI|nr:Gag-pro-like protein [Gossypium australe]